MEPEIEIFPPEHLAYVPRKVTIRARLVLLCAVLCGLCIVAAYTLKEHPESPDPNIIWLLFAFWPGALGAVIGFGSWLLTGRPW